ncbi:uncharacterized protein N7496_006412 [Penicillium cataractarum]|uniref:CHCH domain-containing protein n=1 Tax=Penicillium cataractarum TaxID=2100454 RepID=A0A9W9S2V8_9EURO|nr:uncharacterized protein N7496_006412 [Penicillium cataractarum]KAJ5370320.1 hypothetical protein N7496_006412 [Penicillium cataractarum]
MSFGAPGGGSVNYKPTPPERGSFPLDHEGECKHIISGYLKCIKLNRGTNDEACRKLAKEYLTCRMDKYVKPITMHISLRDFAPGQQQALENTVLT